MNKKALLSSFTLLSCALSHTSYAALSSTALLNFDTGVAITDPVYGYTIGFQGSYFSLDTNGDGAFTVNEGSVLTPGYDGGILLGQTQLTYDVSTGDPTPIDSTWYFAGNPGTYQNTSPVTIFSDDGNGSVFLDFSDWGVTFVNTINIGLGGSPEHPSDTGLATVVCSLDCSNGDFFTLDYNAHVASDDPSGFGDVYWQLHLEGTVVSPVPVPAAVWLFGSGLILLASLARRKQS